jgi:hypothetical protein
MTNDEFVDAFRRDPVAALRRHGLGAVADDVEQQLGPVIAAADRLAHQAVSAPRPLASVATKE